LLPALKKQKVFCLGLCKGGYGKKEEEDRAWGWGGSILPWSYRQKIMKPGPLETQYSSMSILNARKAHLLLGTTKGHGNDAGII